MLIGVINFRKSLVSQVGGHLTKFTWLSTRNIHQEIIWSDSFLRQQILLRICNRIFAARKMENLCEHNIFDWFFWILVEFSKFLKFLKISNRSSVSSNAIDLWSSTITSTYIFFPKIEKSHVFKMRKTEK